MSLVNSFEKAGERKGLFKVISVIMRNRFKEKLSFLPLFEFIPDNDMLKNICENLLQKKPEDFMGVKTNESFSVNEKILDSFFDGEFEEEQKKEDEIYSELSTEKVNLMKAIYNCSGCDSEGRGSFIDFIDSAMQLPPEFDNKCKDEMINFEQKNNESYIRDCCSRGEREGLLLGINMILEHRFDKNISSLFTMIKKIDDIKELEKICEHALLKKPEELKKILKIPEIS